MQDEQEHPQETPAEAPPATEPATTEVPVEPAEPLKVSWNEADVTPVPTIHEVRTVRIYANESGRQLRVMKTADAADCLHIYVDVL